MKFLKEVAQIERAKKGQVYPRGCSLIKLSATDEQIGYLETAGEVDTRYAVIIPDRKEILDQYLRIILKESMEEFLYKHRTGMNLQFSELEFLKIPVPDMEQQEIITNCINALETEIQHEEQEVLEWQKFKEYMLEKMFA